jgi:PAS domain S-box-containing protein
LGKGVWDGFSIGENGSLADMMLDNPDSIEKHYGDSVVSKTESGWYELEMFLPKLKEGKRTLLTAAQILDDNGMLRGAIQTIQEIKMPQVEKVIAEGGGSGSLNEAFVSPVFKIDAQGKITFWNYACEENFGYTSSEMVGKSALELLAKRYRPLFNETIAKALEDGASGSKTLKYVHRKGKPLYVLARAYAVEADDGKHRECVVVNTDITNLRLRLKRLEVDAAERKEKLKTLSEEYNLLKKNLATFIRKKNKSNDGNEDAS